MNSNSLLLYSHNESDTMAKVRDFHTLETNSLPCNSSEVNQMDEMLEGSALLRGMIAFLIDSSRGMHCMS